MAEAVGKLTDFEAVHPSVSEKEWVSHECVFVVGPGLEVSLGQ